MSGAPLPRKVNTVEQPMAKAKAKTIHNDLVAIKQLFNFAVRRGMIKENPLKELKLSQPKPTPQPYWQRNEVDAIVAQSNERYRILFHFLADTGCRIGEAEWLTWDDVDFDKRLIHIREKLGWRPKTGDMRVVPLCPNLLNALHQLSRRSQWVFTAAESRSNTFGGRQISARRGLAHLKIVLKRLGLKGHLHTFRHSFISHALVRGVPEAMVRKWVGHVDPEIIRIYTHIADQQSRQAIEGLFPAAAPPTQAPSSNPKDAQNVRRKDV